MSIEDIRLKLEQHRATSSYSEPDFAIHIPLPKTEPSSPESEPMAQNNNRTLKELAAPNLDQKPLCIENPNPQVNFELKSGMIHLLPTFHGLAGEDPNKHLKEFHVVCCTMKPAGVSEEQVKLMAFPFSLADSAKEWLY